MGREIMRAIAASEPSLQLAGVWVRPDSPLLDRPMTEFAGPAASEVTASCDLSAVLATADVAIDFSLPAAVPNILQEAVKARKALVCGVSGLDQDTLTLMQSAARTVPLFYDRNMSIGVALLRRMVEQSGQVLGEGFSATISDLHHAEKRDAPSGTALMLGETLAAARGQDFKSVMRYDSEQAAVARNSDDIVFDVRREGLHPGAHTVVLAGPDENLSFSHTVTDRRVFAVGALRAAKWLHERPPGLYSMQDLLQG